MKVLFVRFSSLGDIILTTGIIKQFKSHFPDTEIHMLTGKGMDTVFEPLDFVDKIYTFDRKKGFSAYIKFLQLHLIDFDLIIDLHSNLRSRFIKYSTDAAYIAYKKHSLKRRMFAKKRWYRDQLHDHVVTRYFQPIADYFNLPIPTPEELRPVLVPTKEPKQTGGIVIHAQASKQTKTWPHFNELIQQLLKNGQQVTLIGAETEETDPAVQNLTGKTSLADLINVIAAADTVITTDSGPLHMAVGLNKNVIVLAGSTTKEFGFLPVFNNCHIIEINDLDCRPCHVHGLQKCPKKHFKCMTSITVDDVIKNLS